MLLKWSTKYEGLVAYFEPVMKKKSILRLCITSHYPWIMKQCTQNDQCIQQNTGSDIMGEQIMDLMNCYHGNGNELLDDLCPLLQVTKLQDAVSHPVPRLQVM